ncbi:hypothetical protein [Cellvibrio sp.]|uniref:hypothetical protein n=1 Tax=Cellvibrio sp. TaxID=1965322 RepID=UPI003964866F
MSIYNEFNDDHVRNFLAAHKRRVWKQETPLDVSAYSKPEPTSKTRIRTRETHQINANELVVQQQR